jgi:hypothetical protein
MRCLLHRLLFTLLMLLLLLLALSILLFLEGLDACHGVSEDEGLKGDCTGRVQGHTCMLGRT